LEQIAKLHETLNQLKEAESALKQLLELRETNSEGTTSKALARSQELLASFYDRHGREQEASMLRSPSDKKE
jgi:vacuolar-type H+-ATPase subunit H